MTPALVSLNGDAYARGLGQALAGPGSVAAVRQAVRDRLASAACHRVTPGARAFLEAQRETTARLVPDALVEIGGIASGFGLQDDEIFEFLHLACLADLAESSEDTDGCTAFARHGILAKNRDFRPEHFALQRVFSHCDPAWGGRSFLCVGSLGAPGAWSSGLNSDGFALADTHISTADHGPGINRYFLMNLLLARCASVDDALEIIHTIPHAGGGSLVLADSRGNGAAVELRATRVDIVTGPIVAHTNHYLAAPDRLQPVVHSIGRLETVANALALQPMISADSILSLHAPEALCRHLPEVPTLSGSVYDCAARTATIALGPPCATPWRRFQLVDNVWREDGT
jgi:isopenicillin-N N-acyltransferase-like protein